MKNRRTIGERLREARLSARLTQVQVANDFLRSRQAVSSWESGKTLPTLSEFRELVTLYGISADRVLFGAEIEDELGLALDRARHQDFEPSALDGV